MNKLKSVFNTQLKKITIKYPKIVYVHVPKCAGSSVADSILAGVYPKILTKTPLTTGIDIFSAAKIAELIQIPEQKVRQVQLLSVLQSANKIFVTGHCNVNPEVVTAYGSDWKFLTVLREPVQRYVSEYVYNTYKPENWKKNTLPIREYIESEVGVSSGLCLSLYFSGLSQESILKNESFAIQKSIDNLKSFYSVGFLDDLNGWITNLNKTLNANIELKLTNRSPSRQVFDDIMGDVDLLNQLKSICRVDTEIFNTIKSISNKKQ
ncbi:hypothetical protein [Glaciecola sp. SC05]|uniref:hypothetical protein n=1 Tax=Glaciecola sp. SC05 TaxID=1987355 RepID=UPI0035291027